MKNEKNKSLKHWLVLLCACGITGSSIGAVSSTAGVFYAPVSESLGILRGSFTLHATFMSLALAFLSLVAPMLIEKFPLKMLVIVGTAVTAGTTVGMAFATQLWQFYVLGVIKGLGAGIYGGLLITTIINNWFYEMNGIAVSVGFAFSGVVGALMSPILTTICETTGWRTAYLILAVVGVIFSLPAILIPFTIKPEDCGYLPYGATSTPEKTTGPKIKTEVPKFNIFNFDYILFLCFAVMITVLTSLATHFSGYASSVGLPVAVGGLMLSASMIGNIGSKLIIGVLCDALGTMKSVILMLSITLLSLLSIFLIHTQTMMIASTLTFGAVYSVAAVGVTLLTRYFFGSENYAKAYSFLCFVTGIGGAIAITVIGFIYDIFGSYNVAFIICIAFMVLSFVILFTLEQRKKSRHRHR